MRARLLSHALRPDPEQHALRADRRSDERPALDSLVMRMDGVVGVASGGYLRTVFARCWTSHIVSASELPARFWITMER